MDRAQAFEPDVILMDLRIPETDGVSAIRLLMEKGIGGRVLLLTTYDTDTDVLPRHRGRRHRAPAQRHPSLRAAGCGVGRRRRRSRPLPECRFSTPRAGATTARETVTERELEVLQLVASGSTNREMAERLFINETTVKTHLLHIYARLGVNDRTAAVGAAFERGLLTPGETTRSGPTP